jgi:predicted metal-dependent RNase
MAKRQASHELLLGDEEAAAAAGVTHVRVTPLGAGQEVGRSCIIVEYA